jgi:hypothetical protein
MGRAAEKGGTAEQQPQQAQQRAEAEEEEEEEVVAGGRGAADRVRRIVLGADEAEYLGERAARIAAAEEDARAAGLAWRVKAATIVSRRPVVLPEPNARKERYFELKEQHATMLGQRVGYPKGFWNLRGEDGNDDAAAAAAAAGGQGRGAGKSASAADEAEKNTSGAGASRGGGGISALHGGGAKPDADGSDIDGDDDLDLLGDLGDLGDLDIDLVVDETKAARGGSSSEASSSSSSATAAAKRKNAAATAAADTFRGFMFASRETDADRDNDRTSLDRALDRHLFLVIKDGSTGGRWGFPSGVVGDSADERRKAARADKGKDAIAPGAVLLDMADRKVREQVGAEVHLSMVLQGSGAPVGMHWEKSAAAAADGYFGDKTFFFKAHVHARAGEPDPQVQLRPRKGGKKSKGKFMWLTREECAALFRKQEAVLAQKSGGTAAAAAAASKDGVQLSALVERLLH